MGLGDQKDERAEEKKQERTRDFERLKVLREATRNVDKNQYSTLVGKYLSEVDREFTDLFFRFTEYACSDDLGEQERDEYLNEVIDIAYDEDVEKSYHLHSNDLAIKAQEHAGDDRYQKLLSRFYDKTLEKAEKKMPTLGSDFSSVNAAEKLVGIAIDYSRLFPENEKNYERLVAVYAKGKERTGGSGFRLDSKYPVEMEMFRTGKRTIQFTPPEGEPVEIEKADPKLVEDFRKLISAVSNPEENREPLDREKVNDEIREMRKGPKGNDPVSMFKWASKFPTLLTREKEINSYSFGSNAFKLVKQWLKAVSAGDPAVVIENRDLRKTKNQEMLKDVIEFNKAYAEYAPKQKKEQEKYENDRKEGALQHAYFEKGLIKDEMDRVRQKNQPLDEMLDLLQKAYSEGDNASSTRMADTILTKFGDKLSEQIEGFCKGPEKADDMSVLKWITENYVAARILACNALVDFDKSRTLDHFNYNFDAPRRMANLFFGAFDQKRYLAKKDKDKAAESDSDYWKWMQDNVRKANTGYAKEKKKKESDPEGKKEAPLYETLRKELAQRKLDKAEKFREDLQRYRNGLKNARRMISLWDSQEYKDMCSNLDTLLEMTDKTKNGDKSVDPWSREVQQKLDELKENARAYFGTKLNDDKNANRAKRFAIAEEIMQIDNDTLRKKVREVEIAEAPDGNGNGNDSKAVQRENKTQEKLDELKKKTCGPDSAAWIEENLFEYRNVLRKSDNSLKRGAVIVCDIIRYRQKAEEKLLDPDALTPDEKLVCERDLLAGKKLEEFFAQNSGKPLADTCVSIAKKYENSRKMSTEMMKTKTVTKNDPSVKNGMEK